MTIQILNENDRSNESKSFMWVMGGYKDGIPIQRFSYNISRSGSVTENLLKGFKGFYLQTDVFDDNNRFDGWSDLSYLMTSSR